MALNSFLLDTSVLLSATIAPERLPEKTAARLRDPLNPVYFSAASIWEIGIKRSLERQRFDFYPEDIHHLALSTDFTELPVRSVHCYEVARLPWHHRDPFDRLLIAQAMTEQICLLTSDGTLSRYSDQVICIKLRMLSG